MNRDEERAANRRRTADGLKLATEYMAEGWLIVVGLVAAFWVVALVLLGWDFVFRGHHTEFHYFACAAVYPTSPNFTPGVRPTDDVCANISDAWTDVSGPRPTDFVDACVTNTQNAYVHLSRQQCLDAEKFWVRVRNESTY